MTSGNPALSVKVTQRLERHEARLNVHEERIERHEARLDRHDDRFEDHAERLAIANRDIALLAEVAGRNREQDKAAIERRLARLRSRRDPASSPRSDRKR